MDTWATSSLTPQIAGGWGGDADLFDAGVPDGPAPAGARDHPDLAVLDGAARPAGRRPAAVAGVAISGWVLDPDRKKMSKSKGNVTTPVDLLERSARTRCATGRAAPGRAWTPPSTRPDEGRPPAGRQDLNASRFVLAFAPVPDLPWSPSRWTGPCSPRSPRWSRTRRPRWTRCDHSRALERTETFFWAFCDDYVELVKGRAYGDRENEDGDGVGARRARRRAGRSCCGCSRRSCRSSTEEVWSWWRGGSVHRRPGRRGTSRLGGDPELLALAAEVLRGSAGPSRRVASRSVRRSSRSRSAGRRPERSALPPRSSGRPRAIRDLRIEPAGGDLDVAVTM